MRNADQERIDTENIVPSYILRKKQSLIYQTEGRRTNRQQRQLRDQYSACPKSQSEHVIDGKKYIVTRHFTGEKDINKVISELAISRANREMGLRN